MKQARTTKLLKVEHERKIYERKIFTESVTVTTPLDSPPSGKAYVHVLRAVNDYIVDYIVYVNTANGRRIRIDLEDGTVMDNSEE